MKNIILRLFLPLAGLCFLAILSLWFITGNVKSSIFVPILGTTTGAILAYVTFRNNLPLRLSRPPGWGLRRFVELCFSKKSFTQVLEPALSDMQKEYFDALHASRPWQARMVLVRGYFSFWSAVAAQLPISFARRVYEVWKATKTGS